LNVSIVDSVHISGYSLVAFCRWDSSHVGYRACQHHAASTESDKRQQYVSWSMCTS